MRFLDKHHSTNQKFLPDEADIYNGKIIFFTVSAYKEGKIGITGLKRMTDHHVRQVCTVISPKHRGKGYGKEASHLGVKEARKLGYGKISSEIYDWNHKQISIKLSQGFVIEGYHKDDDAPGLSHYTLGKMLNEDTETESS